MKDDFKKMFSDCRYQKLWKSYVKLRHLLANSPKVKQIEKQKLTQREVGGKKTDEVYLPRTVFIKIKENYLKKNFVSFCLKSAA